MLASVAEDAYVGLDERSRKWASEPDKRDLIGWKTERREIRLEITIGYFERLGSRNEIVQEERRDGKRKARRECLK